MQDEAEEEEVEETAGVAEENKEVVVAEGSIK